MISKDTLKQMAWEYRNPQSIGHSKSSLKREIHGITGLPQETRKISNKQSKFDLQVLEKRRQQKRTMCIEGRKW